MRKTVFYGIVICIFLFFSCGEKVVPDVDSTNGTQYKFTNLINMELANTTGFIKYGRFSVDGIDAKIYRSHVTNKYSDLVIVFFGGSEGGFPKLYNFDYYRKLGISCISIAYFKSKYSRKEFDRIDLFTIKTLIDHCQKKFDLEKKKTLVFGYSKGAELALLFSSLYRSINGVFVINPSSVVFQSPGSLGDGRNSSSWVNKGVEIPYVELDYIRYKKSRKKRYLDLYKYAKKSNDRDDAYIKVENINGPILIVSGSDDVVWPSYDMSEEIIERLNVMKFRYWNMHFSDTNAGHTLNPFYGLGGTFRGNFKAKKDMKKRIENFLDEVLRK